nr:non-ribosomal peptide synthetase [Patulibacter sp. SYSU D01012]
MTAAQRGVWFSQQYLGDDAVYGATEIVDVAGPLDPVHWVQAVTAVVAETDALRVRIVGPDHDPRQLVDPEIAADPRIVDLRGEADPEAAADAWAAAALREPIDLRAGVLAETVLFVLGPERFRWLQRVHHLALDGYGFALVARRVAAHVRALAGGGPAPAPPSDGLAAVVADDAAYAGSAQERADREHWLAAMGDLESVPGLTEGEVAPSGRTVRAGLVVGPDRVAALTAVGARSGGGWPEALAAGCAALLHGLTGSRDVVVGLPVLARPDAGALRRPSNAQNVVPLRAHVDPGASVDALVAQVAGTLAAGRPHARFRHETLRRELGLFAGDGRLAGLFLNLKPFVQELRFGHAGAARRVTGRVRAVWEGPVEDLSLSVWGTPDGGLEIAIDAPAGPYDEASVRAHRDRLDGLLAALADADAATTVAELPIATPAERDAVAAFGSGPAMPAPDASLVDRFRARVAADPSAPAVAGPDGALTAGELDARSAALAARLVAAGAGRERVVAIAHERGAGYVAAMLAVLRAGAAFLPLDAELPAERLTFLLEDSGAVAVVGDAYGAARLPATGLPLVRTDDERGGGTGAGGTADPDAGAAPATAGAADGAALDAAAPGDAAYVIYTSGTTGRPKGVVIEHRTAVNLLDGHARTLYGPAAAAAGRERIRFSHNHSFSFDSGISPFLALLAGHELRVAAADVLRDPAALAAFVRDERIDYVDVTPAMFEALVAEGVLDEGRHVPTLVALGGEAAPPDLWRRLRAHPTTIGWNTYGPTECTVDAVICPVADHPTPVIGRPIAGSRAYVLDDARRPVPPGVAGELFVGGRNVGRGYLGRPELTAERFLPDPWAPADEPDARMYATGDRVRWTAEGLLEFLGRADDQVKLRGFRIELGEVAAALNAQDDVAQAVAVVREDRPGDRRLVAYVVPAPGARPDPAALIAAAGETLPHHAVPSAVVVLDALPMTVSRKVDRARLPAPDPAAVTAADRPRTPEEELVCAVVAETLGLPAVGVHDDVFALGAHSLLVARMAARLREDLGADCGVRTVFDHPTPALLAAALTGPAAAPRPAPAPRPAAAATPTDRPDDLPLAPAQRRLWFLQRLDGPDPTYDVPVVLRLRGIVDVRALRAALADVLARHETLRTTYPERDGAPVQAIAAPGTVEVPFAHELVAPDGLDARIAALSRHVFDVTTDLPLRATLLTVDGADDEPVLLLVLHHVAADGWSLGPLVGDLSRAYAARREDREGPSVLPPLAVQHADHALALAAAGDDEAGLAFWADALRGIPDALELPADRAAGADASRDGGEVRTTIPAAVHARLAALAREHGATTFMALHAILAGLLTRVGAGTDVPVGTVVVGRDAPGLDEVVGFFANTVVLRADTDGAPDLPTLLRRVRQADLAALAHADVPFDRVVERLRPPRAPGRTPLFNVMLVLQNTPDAAWAEDSLDAALEVRGNGTAKFDLTFELAERFDAAGAPAGLDLRVEHRAARFDRETAEGLAAWFARLADAWSADPEQDLWAPRITGPGEVVPVATAVPPPRPADAPGAALLPADPAAETLDGWLARTVAAHPERPALTGPGGPLTYAELDARATRLARALLARGARRGTLVALALPRTVDLVVALIAILRTGAGYLPLDPAYPAERLRATVEDAGPVLAVTDGAVDAATLGGVPTLRLDDPATTAELAALPADPLTPADRPPARPDDVAYVIYTSGSTGRPKGVQVAHRNVVRLFTATDGWFGFGPDDTWTLFHSAAFDFSVWELWGALLHGGRLVVIPHDVSRAPAAFLRLLVDERVTVLSQTPSAFWALVAADGDDPATGAELALRLVVFGGEALELAKLRPWYERHPDDAPRLVNMYGITETTVHVTYRPLTADDARAAAPGDPSPIGVPIPDLDVRVLDAGGHPVPPNVVGELHVAGGGVARGYLGRPALNAERFPPDPSGPDAAADPDAAAVQAARLPRPDGDDAPPARRYRTGDLARVRRDGGLDYLGRADGQVKVRGFRIEPGEIEAVLRAEVGVRDAVVIVREDRPGDQRLVAYVVPADGAAPPAPDALRAAAARRLPAHMVPAATVVLDALPLTPNGKLDRRALPAPDPAPAGEGRAPEGVAEERLCRLFADALGVERVGADDSFFELGGHSLLAVRLLRDVADAFGTDVGIGALFEAPTPAGLARALQDGTQASPLEVILPLRMPRGAGRVDGRGPGGEAADAAGGGAHAAGGPDADGPAPVFCVHPAGGLSWCYSGLARHLPPDRPLVGIQARGIARPEPLPPSLGAMADDYVARIREVRPHGPYHLLGWSLGGMVVHAMAARLRAQGHEVGVVALLDAYPSDGLRRIAPPDEAEALSALLAMGGYGEEVLRGRVISVDVVVDALRAEGSAMASIAPDTLMAIKDTYVNTATILREYEHEVYAGDVLFLRASVGVIDEDQTPQTWQPYVDGRLEVHDVACTHREMCQPEPLARIGALVAERLADWEAGRR